MTGARSTGQETSPGGADGGTVRLGANAAAFLAIVAAHDGLTPEAFLTRAICARLDEIGLSTALDLLSGEASGHANCAAGGLPRASSGEKTP